MLYHIYIDDKYYKDLNAKITISIGDIISINGAKYTVRKIVHDTIACSNLLYTATNIYCY